MGEILLITDDFYFNIDSLFYNKHNIKQLQLNNYSDYNNIIKDKNINSFENIIVLITDIMFDSIAKTSHPFNTSKHGLDNLFNDNEDLFFNNFNKFFKNFPTKTKYVLVDNNPESPMKPIERFIFKWLELSPNNYFISSRFNSVNHPNALVGLVYLSLFYGFYQQNFHKYPKLDYAQPCNTKHNFITFLGHSSKPDKIEFRLNFLKELFKDRINQIKYETDSEKKLGLKYYKQPSLSGHEWNLLESLSVKIQLIFETINPLKEYHDGYFFSEKTMKLFLLPHPYFLLAHGTALMELEKFGFKFPIKCFSFDDYLNSINTILEDVDKWVDENYKLFQHNQDNFYEMVNSIELPHHLFFDKIINA